MGTRLRSSLCILVILVFWGPCGIGSVFSDNRKPKNVPISLRIKWPGTSLLLEAGELMFKEWKDHFWDFIEVWLHNEKDNFGSYTAKDCLKKILAHGRSLLREQMALVFEFSLILRSASPRLVLYQQLAEESLSSFPLSDESSPKNVAGEISQTNEYVQTKELDSLNVDVNP